MTAKRKDHLVDMVIAISRLQSDWTDIYQWSLNVREREVKPLQLNDYEVLIKTASENEMCILLLLLQEVSDLHLRIYSDQCQILCS